MSSPLKAPHWRTLTAPHTEVQQYGITSNGMTTLTGKQLNPTTLGRIRRNITNNHEIKIRAYNTLVCPVLDYASSIWDPHKDKVQAIQRRGARCLQQVP